MGAGDLPSTREAQKDNHAHGAVRRRDHDRHPRNRRPSNKQCGSIDITLEKSSRVVNTSRECARAPESNRAMSRGRSYNIPSEVMLAKLAIEIAVAAVTSPRCRREGHTSRDVCPSIATLAGVSSRLTVREAPEPRQESVPVCCVLPETSTNPSPPSSTSLAFRDPDAGRHRIVNKPVSTTTAQQGTQQKGAWKGTSGTSPHEKGTGSRALAWSERFTQSIRNEQQAASIKVEWQGPQAASRAT